MGTLHVGVCVILRGVDQAGEEYLEGLTDRLEELGAIGPAVVFYPEDKEISMTFDIEEEALGRVLQPERSRAAA